MGHFVLPVFAYIGAYLAASLIVFSLAHVINLTWKRHQQGWTSTTRDLSAYHDTLNLNYLNFSEIRLLKQNDLSRNEIKGKLMRSEATWKKIKETRETLPDNFKLWQRFKPCFNCPHFVEKIGTDGKWICGFELYETEPKPQDCAVYIWGNKFADVNNDFEKEWSNRTLCKVIRISENGTKSLRDTMADHELGWIDVIVLDLDDDQKFNFINSVFNDYDEVLPFAQLTAKFVLNEANDTYAEYSERFKNMFAKLEDKGLRPFYMQMDRERKIEWENATNDKLEISLDYSFLNIKGKHILLVGNED